MRRGAGGSKGLAMVECIFYFTCLFVFLPVLFMAHKENRPDTKPITAG